jgi:hypothetical protein
MRGASAGTACCAPTGIQPRANADAARVRALATCKDSAKQFCDKNPKITPEADRLNTGMRQDEVTALRRGENGRLLPAEWD